MIRSRRKGERFAETIFQLEDEQMRLKREKLIAGAFALAVALALTVVGFARQEGQRGFGPPPPPPPGEHGRGGPHGGALGPLARELDLTDAQKAQIKQLTDAFEESTKSLHEQMFKSGGGPLEGLKDGAFDEAGVRAAAQSRAAIQVELEVAHARLMSQIYALLTDAQKAKVAELRQQFQQRRPGPPPPPAEGAPNMR
jgi:periplasmic protein CpxP/Spy